MRTKFTLGVSLLAIVSLLSLGGCGSKSGTDESKSTVAISGNEGQAADGNATQKAPPVLTPPEIVLDTDKGPITIRLHIKESPKTVENFLDYVKSRFYDGTIFHQVYKNQGIIAGAYTENMAAKETKSPIYNEAINKLKNKRGTVAMIHDPDNPDSATSVFTINVVDNPSLDFTDPSTPEGCGYCVFGEVIQGMETVDRIAAVEVRDTDDLPCSPVNKVAIKSAKRIK